MRPADDIHKRIKNLNLKVSADLDNRINAEIDNALANEQNKSSVEQLSLWRIIMKTKTAKFTTAAVLLLAALSLTLLDKTVSPVYALEQSLQVMKKAPWMQAANDMQDVGDKTGRVWFSKTHGISASVNDDGSAQFCDLRKNEMYRYNPATEEISITAVRESTRYSRSNATIEYLQNMINEVSEIDSAEITTTYEVKKGKKLIIIEIKIPKDELQGSVRAEFMRLTIDEKTCLPIKFEMKGYKGDQIEIDNCVLYFNFPSTGPMNIYQLGIPKTAKIIDKRPGAKAIK